MKTDLPSKARSIMPFLMRHYLFLPQLVAAVFGYMVWVALDRTPPLVLFDGKITPNVVTAGEQGIKVTWRARYSGRDCPGLTQRELIDSGRHLWPELKRVRGGIFKPDSGQPLIGTVDTPTLAIPSMAPGKAQYRVTQFYYCNWLQRLLNWPIVQVSPFVTFEVSK